MGLGLGAIQNLLELNSQGLLKDKTNVLDIGSQEIHISGKDLKELFENAGLEKNLVDTFPNINNFPSKPRPSSKYLYNSFGLNNYECLDINGEHGAIKFDLNHPFNDETKFEKFDIVTDFGSCEHVYNIGETYKTIHKLTKTNGLIIIIQSLFQGNGYFTLEDTFLEGLAAANDYKILHSSYVITTGEKSENGSYLQFHIPRHKKLLKVMDLTKLNGNNSEQLEICMVMQKTSKKEFKIPYQGDLMSKNYNFSGFNKIFKKEPMSHLYIPSSKMQIEEASIVEIVKALFKWIHKKIKLFIKKIIMKLKS